MRPVPKARIKLGGGANVKFTKNGTSLTRSGYIVQHLLQRAIEGKITSLQGYLESYLIVIYSLVLRSKMLTTKEEDLDELLMEQ